MFTQFEIFYLSLFITTPNVYSGAFLSEQGYLQDLQTGVPSSGFDTSTSNLKHEQFSSNVHKILELNFVTKIQECQAW